MRVRVPGGTALIVALLLVGLLPVRPAAAGARQVCGSVQGEDGRFVRAAVTLVLTPAGSQSLELNPDLATAEGVVPGSPEDTGDLEDTFCFEGVPLTATGFELRAVPLGATGTTDTVRYGGAALGPTSLPPEGQTGLQLPLPLGCESGGDTGSLAVQAYSNGSPTRIARVVAVAEAPSATTGSQGYGLHDPGGAGPTSPVVLRGLEAGVRYSVEVVFANRSRRSTFAEVLVRPCATTTIRAWTGAKPFGTPNRWTSVPQTVNGSYLPVAGDFTGDGRTDLFFYAPGSVMDHLWEAQPGGRTFTSRPIPIGGSYRAVGGDFDGDGIDDIFFFAPGATPDLIWRFSAGGTHTVVPASASALPTTWPHAGDFDGNGVDDLLFFTPNGADSVWFFEPGGAHRSAPIALSGSANVEVGDVDGDGRDDIYHHDTLTGVLRVHFGNADGTFTVRSGSTVRTYLPIVGDLSCDGRADVVQYRPGPASDVLWRGRSAASPMYSQEPANLDVRGSYLYPTVGDFDGNGCEDVFWYQPGRVADSVWLNDSVGWNLPRSTVSGSF